jgi:hypothetical protein
MSAVFLADSWFPIAAVLGVIALVALAGALTLRRPRGPAPPSADSALIRFWVNAFRFADEVGGQELRLGRQAPPGAAELAAGSNTAGLWIKTPEGWQLRCEAPAFLAGQLPDALDTFLASHGSLPVAGKQLRATVDRADPANCTVRIAD